LITKKLIVFDKDGTLIDIHRYWGRMIEVRSLLISNLCESQPDKIATYTWLIDLMGFDLEKAKLKPEGPVGIKPRKYIVDLVSELICQRKLNLSAEDIEETFLLVDEFS
jgi:phosphoglycolate phosphatase-like HAD superfamily hydrolase